MPHWEFECNDCKSACELTLPAEDSFDIVRCPDCLSDNLKIIQYDSINNLTLRSLSLDIMELEARFEKLQSDFETKKNDPH